MSKTTDLSAGVRGPGAGLGYWRHRLFRNSYTHQGRRRLVRGWSLKIQHQNRRKTFSFPGLDRDRAARKARSIYRRLVRDGWDGVQPPDVPVATTPARIPTADAAESWSRSDVRFWRARLMARRYPWSASEPTAAALSAGIDFGGATVWFPLRAPSPEAAAGKALAIYQEVAANGWGAVFKRHSREVTLALHWGANPLAWTYATFHTAVADHAIEPVPRRKSGSAPGLDVAIIEPELGLRRALARWIDAQPGTLCVAAYGDPSEALRATIPPKRTLWLVNGNLPLLGGIESLARLQRLVPDFCGLTYSVHHDSAQLFGSCPGGARAYVLKRTPPERILEPLLGAPRGQALSARGIAQLAREYFQREIGAMESNADIQAWENLTEREREILQSLGRGYLDKEIAVNLGISAWTVRGHLKRIFRKLNVHTRTAAVIHFLQK